MTTLAPAGTTREKTQQFLSFTLPSNISAMLPTQHLTEILNVSAHQIVPIPDTLQQVMGVYNWRGEVLWLLDLGLLLGVDSLSNQNYHHTNYSAIVTHFQGYTLGLVVDHVNQMLWCDPEQIQPIPTTQHTPRVSPCLRGYWLSPQGDMLLVLDTEVLIDIFRSQSE